jgi:lycopene beta-cyclase
LEQTYEYIIVGGGCAGLSLAYHLGLHRIRGKILLLEPQAKDRNDRTWCFWSCPGETPLKHLASKSWPRLNFGSTGEQLVQSIGPYRYFHIAGKDYYDQLITGIRHNPCLTWKRENVTGITQENEQVRVVTDTGEYTARWIFNSSRRFSRAAQLPRYQLLQHFIGLTIRTETEAFNPSRATVMDFNVPQDGAVRFFYVLPLDSRTALVEYTIFSRTVLPDEVYRTEIRAYVRELGIRAYTVIAEEKGAIPMTDTVFARTCPDRCIHIGTAGGLTKATTGYTFRRVQLDVQHIIRQLQQTGDPRPSVPNWNRFRFIAREPGQVKRIFTHLFRRNRFSTILRFLDEQTSIRDEIRIFLTLPWMPFIRAIFRHYFSFPQPETIPEHGRTLSIT